MSSQSETLMSLDHFNSDSNNDDSVTESESEDDSESREWESPWHIYPSGYWENIDEKYFSEDTPNSPPLFSVPEKLAADINILSDPDVVSEVAEWWNPNREEDFNEVIQIVFNDFSTWHIPVRPWDKDYTRTRIHTVEKYLPQVVKWQAILDGDDPNEVLSKWSPPWEDDRDDWEDDIGNTEISEDTRKWLNRHASWLPELRKEVESTDEDVDLDIDDEDWTDDW